MSEKGYGFTLEVFTAVKIYFVFLRIITLCNLVVGTSI